MTFNSPKSELRQALMARILAMPPAQRSQEQAGLDQNFPTLPHLAASDQVLLYAHAFPEEIETSAMLGWVLAQGKQLVLPRVIRSERGLRLFRVSDLARDLRAGVLGIPEPANHCLEVEPSQIDWVLVPGLGFNRAGFRIGRGAGHYDRLLPRLRPDAAKVALCFSVQWVEELPVESHDQPVDYVADFRQVIRTPFAS